MYETLVMSADYEYTPAQLNRAVGKVMDYYFKERKPIYVWFA